VNGYISAQLDGQDVGAFDCGVATLNEWLCGQAARAKKSGTAKTYVWTADREDRVVAYYAVAPHVVHRDQVTSGMAGGVSVIPAYLLARLALDRSLHGQGLGGELLHDALNRIVEAAEVASGRLIVVDAIDDDAAKFYRKYDFQPVKDNPRRLVIKIATVRAALR
jgi:GNAT superfamily N-acetyltransferase